VIHPSERLSGVVNAAESSSPGVTGKSPARIAAEEIESSKTENIRADTGKAIMTVSE
jgi:hypothetical protein